jgi:hypothetical protein
MRLGMLGESADALTRMGQHKLTSSASIYFILNHI